MKFGKNEMFMILMSIIGLVLLVISWNIGQKSTGCSDRDLHNANRVCLVLGAVISTASLSFLTWQSSCADKLAAATNKMYMGAIMVLSFVVMVLGSVIHSKTSSSCDVKSQAGFLIAMGVFGILIPGAYFVAPMVM